MLKITKSLPQSHTDRIPSHWTCGKKQKELAEGIGADEEDPSDAGLTFYRGILGISLLGMCTNGCT